MNLEGKGEQDRGSHTSPHDKLDVHLRQLADEAPKEHVSVLIELDVPGPRIKLDRPARGEMPRWPHGRIESETDADRVRLEQIVTEARRSLQEIVGSEPVWLSASRAFVVDTTVERVIEIARAPFVLRIHENRLRR